jgi:hypothetical protein
LEAEVETQRALRIQNFLFGSETGPRQMQIDRLENRETAEKYGYTFRANAAVKALLDREASGQEVQALIHEFGFKDAGSGRKMLSINDIFWLCSGGKGLAYTIDDLLPSQDMYLTEEVSLEATMRVPGIPLKPLIGNKYVTKETVARIGIWDSNPSLDSWADRLISRMNESRAYGIIPVASDVLGFLREDREWVSDDSIIIELVRQDTFGLPPQTVLVVTTDRKLCKAICDATGNYVVVVHPDVLIHLSGRSQLDASMTFRTELAALKDLINLREARPAITYMYVDYGSLKATAIGSYPTQEQSPFYKTRLVKRVDWKSNRFPEGRELRERFQVVDDVLNFRAQLISPNSQTLIINCRSDNFSGPTVPLTRSKRLGRYVVKSTQRLTSSVLGLQLRPKKHGA